MEKLFVLSFALVFLCGAIVFLLRIKIEAHLETKHPDTWAALGCPKIIRVASHLAANERLVAYLSDKEYLKLNDLSLNRLALSASTLSRVAVFLVFIVICFGIAAWVLPSVQARQA